MFASRCDRCWEFGVATVPQQCADCVMQNVCASCVSDQKCSNCGCDLCDQCSLARDWRCPICSRGSCCTECFAGICGECQSSGGAFSEKLIEKPKKKKKKKKSKKKRKKFRGLQIRNREVIRKIHGRKKCYTCVKEFYDEFGLTEFCQDCGAEAPERRPDENVTTKVDAKNSKTKSRLWTDEETKTMLRLHAAGKSDEKIGKKLRRSADSVNMRRANMKMKKQHPSKGIRRDFKKLQPLMIPYFKTKNGFIANTKELQEHVRTVLPDIADDTDVNVNGRPHYAKAIIDFLQRRKTFTNIGRVGKNSLWKYKE